MQMFLVFSKYGPSMSILIHSKPFKIDLFPTQTNPTPPIFSDTHRYTRLVAYSFPDSIFFLRTTKFITHPFEKITNNTWHTQALVCMSKFTTIIIFTTFTTNLLTWRVVNNENKMVGL